MKLKKRKRMERKRNFSEGNIWSCFAVWLLKALVGMKNSRDYWKNDKIGLFGNEFVKSTLTKYKYHNINRNIHMNIQKGLKNLESLSKKYSMSTERKEEFTKNENNGITTRKVVDEKGFVYSMSFEGGSRVKKFQKKLFLVRGFRKNSNPFLFRRPLRCKMMDLLYTAINNSLIFYLNSHPNEKKMTISEYIEKVLPHIRKQRKSYVPPPWLTKEEDQKILNLHSLEKFPTRKSCIICSKRTYFGCKKCSNDQKDVHLCYQGYCSLLFHNPGLEIEIK
jgi:hypothetical protein